MKERIVTLDIETSPRIGLFFGSTYKPNIGKVIQESHVFGFSWKPLGRKVQSCYIWDFPLYKKDPTNDIEVVKKWLEVVSNHHIVVGQNSRQFDDKVMMGRVIVHQLPPPSPFASVDTMADTKRVARYDSNRLDDVAKQYGFGGKAETGGIELWWACLQGDKKAQNKMVKYCERDVILTEKRYLRELPYYKTHPSLSLIRGHMEACPRCGGYKLQSRGYSYTTSNKYQRFQCQTCGRWSRKRLAEFTPNKVEYV